MSSPEGFETYTIPTSLLGALGEGVEHQQSWELFQSIEEDARKYLLVQFYNKVKEQPEAFGKTSPLHESWDVLMEMERDKPEVVESLLTSPATGSWLSHTLRRLQGERSDRQAPLWADVGYFNALVAGFAHHSGMDFTLTVPTIDGKAFLPQVGSAMLSDRSSYGTATVESRDNVLHINNSRTSLEITDTAMPNTNWRPVIRHESRANLATTSKDIALTVTLDDADPYNTATPYELSAEETTEWHTMLDETWNQLAAVHPRFAEGLSRRLSVIVPSARRKQFEASSSSADINIGSIEMSLPTNPIEAGEMIVHESCGHGVLNSVLGALELIKNPPTRADQYAPWRDDPRPLMGLLHGIYSFSRVVDYYTTQRSHLPDGTPRADLADFERLLWGQQVQTAAHALSRRLVVNDSARLVTNPLDRLTGMYTQEDGIITMSADSYSRTRGTLGGTHRNTFLEAMDTRVKQYEVLPTTHSKISPTVAAHVRLAIADHKALWNAYHRRPTPEDVSMFVNAWTMPAHVEMPKLTTIRPILQPDPSACRLNARAILARHHILDPEGFEQAFHESESMRDKADRALILGKLSTAEALYEGMLEANPLDKPAFIGLALSTLQGDPGFAAKAMTLASTVIDIQARLIDTTGRAPHYSKLLGWLLEPSIEVQTGWYDYLDLSPMNPRNQL
ncbi:MAG: aKG-HExxH-type peptide beta-hydroxylase [Candidatus Saccharibacteria bacterium]